MKITLILHLVVLFQKKFKLEERINADLIDRALGTLISFHR